MVKTQADGEDNQNADYLSPWVKTMYPGAFVEVEENIHNKLINRKLEMGSQSFFIIFSPTPFTYHPHYFFNSCTISWTVRASVPNQLLNRTSEGGHSDASTNRASSAKTARVGPSDKI